VAADGTLACGLVTKRSDKGWIGYAVTAERQTYFRYQGGALALVAPEDADEALEEVAFGFVDEWIWYDEQDAPVERTRFADYGTPVRGANVRSEKLALLRQNDLRISTLDQDAAPVRAALAKWLSPA
jgi:hypothetical protein